MPKLRMIILALGLCGFAVAGPIEITYDLDFGAGTLNGNNATSIMVFQTDGTQTNLSYPYTLPGIGLQQLTVTSAFQPTGSLIVGLDLLSPSMGDGKTHVFFFTNDAFAQASFGVLFSAAFPNTRHNNFISHLTAAENGSSADLAWLHDFFTTGDGVPALFSGTQPTGIEFTSGVPFVVPEPGTFGLIGAGVALLWFAPRARASRKSRG